MTTEVKNKKLDNSAYNKLFCIMNVPRSNGNFNIMVNEGFPFRLQIDFLQLTRVF